MNEMTGAPGRADEAEAGTGVIDCDIHPRLKGPEDLKPFMESRWWDYWQTYGVRRRHGYVKGHPFPKIQPADGMRRDAWPPEGGQPGSSVGFMRDQHLDPARITWGICNPLGPTGQGDLHHDFSVALARATNEWQVGALTDVEPRLRSSIVVPYEEPEASAAEIRRCAPDPRYAQVMLLTRTAEALGRRKYWPIYREAAAAGLPVGIHVFGYSGFPATNTGWPSFYVEEMTEHETCCSALLISMIMEGLFEEIPDLKIVMVEAGFAWLPALGWRMDHHWRHLKSEVPHLKMAPSEYLKRNVWVTTQPMEEPEDKAHLNDIVDWIGEDRIMFASDYPHWDYDDPRFSLPYSLGKERRQKILFDNAHAIYRLG